MQRRPTKQPSRAPISDNRFYVVLLSIAAVVVVLGLGGCAVLSAIVNDSVDESSKELNESLRRSQNRDSITNEQARGVAVGTDRDDVVRRFGPPAFGPADDPEVPPDIRDCISWHVRDGRYGSTWRFCFRDSKLVSRKSTEDPEPGGRRPPRPTPRRPSREE